MDPAPTAGNGANPNVRRVQDALNGYLADNPTFLAMDPQKQVDFYRHALASGLSAIEQPSFEQADRDRRRDDRPPQPTGTDPTRLGNVAGLAGDFLDQVDFPTFVQGLVTGTYGSIVKSTIEQMQAYVEMYKGLAEPLGSIVKSISDDDGMSQLASSDPIKFTMGGDGEITDNDTGMTLDRTNAEVQRMLFEAKLELARQRRMILFETMAFGVQRLVVDQGTIKAGVLFNIKATEKSQQRARDTRIKESGGQAGGTFFGLFGGGKSDKETLISVSTKSLDTDTALAAQISGNVEIHFTTDRFDLNNFATQFGDEATKSALQKRQGAQPGAPAAGGAPTAPPATVPARAPGT